MESEAVREFIRREVEDWEEEAIATARFKAFSGQRSDWEPRYQFWRDLILKVATHFHLLFISPSQVFFISPFHFYSPFESIVVL